jgi:signal peptidase I
MGVVRQRHLSLLLLVLVLVACGGSEGGEESGQATTSATAAGEWTVVLPAESMAPTIRVGDRVALRPLAGDPQRGHIVIFRLPSLPDGPTGGPEESMIKRVVALPGETVEFRAGRLLVNGEVLDEPYLEEPALGDFPPRTIPDGAFWVMGDNRNRSSDSRVFGPVGRSDIYGFAVRIDAPPEHRRPL